MYVTSVFYSGKTFIKYSPVCQALEKRGWVKYNNLCPQEGYISLDSNFYIPLFTDL